ncbi:MAG TPA: extracellular solute-binding protein [Dehalococcoidia bacterium]|nr:extracellular solute-binding protein [Dehalococcoidia bacterium]
MHKSFPRPLWLILSLLAILSLAAFAACGDDDDDDDGGETTAPGETDDGEPTDDGGGGDIGSVDVIGLWGAEEEDNLRALVAPWEDETGGSLSYTGTRDDVETVRTRVEGGDPPDVYFPASLGFFRELQADGELMPLSSCANLDLAELESMYGASLDDFTIDGEVYGFLFKSGMKGTVWYSPTAFSDANYEVPETYDELIALSDQIVSDGGTPWSVAEFANGGTGFPGSDFIQQFLIKEFGPEVYDQVASGEIPYTDDRVKSAWEKYGEIVLTDGYVVGGPTQALATTFSEGSLPLFEDPPGAYMHYLGAFNSGFITDTSLGFPEGLVAGEDFDFFRFPTIDSEFAGAVTGDGNMAVIFNNDETTCSFLEHVASPEAQEIWVGAGGFLSVNNQVPTSAYPNEIDQRVAEVLGSTDAIFRFDLDDAQGSAPQVAVFAGVQEYIQGGDLDDILSQIAAAYE